MVAEDVLSCFRACDPPVSLAPVAEDPPELEGDACEEVQAMVEVVVARYTRSLPSPQEPAGPPPV